MKALLFTGFLLLGLPSILLAQPPNDLCSGAITVPNLLSAQTISVDLTTATESLDASCETVSTDNLDLWYSFVMPVNGNLQITGVFGFNRIALFDACGGVELSCQIGNGIIPNLSTGTTYLLRYSIVSGGLATDNFTMQAFATPTNNTCSAAAVLGNPDASQAISLSLPGLTESLDASCETASNYNRDAWYEFVMPYDGNLQISGVFGTNTVSLYDACGGIEVVCIAGNGIIDSLTSGTTYLLRYGVISSSLTNDNFTIRSFPFPANNLCQNALPIPSIGSAQVITPEVRGASQSTVSTCEDSVEVNRDVWYSFVMPVNGRVRITGASVVERSTIYDACGGNEVGCLAGSGFIYNLFSGTTYWYKYSRPTAYAGAGTLSLEAFSSASNDECSSPDSIGDITTLQTISLDTQEATESLDASCETASNDNLDLWYTFTMPFNGKIKIDGPSIIKRTVLYDGCGGAELDCLAGTGFLYQLIGGSTYLLRYATPATNAATETITLQAFPTASNDECSSPLAIGSLGSVQTMSLDTREASESLNASCEDSSLVNSDLWYSLEMPFDGNLNFQGVFGVNRLSLYDGCGGAELRCRQGSGLITDLDSGATYQLRYAANSGNAAQDDFTIEALPLASNDACDSALAIADVTVPTTIAADTRAATESLDASCEVATEEHLDLWYSFMMPYNGYLSISQSFGQHQFSLFDSCTGAELGCFTGDGNFEALQSGQTYLLRYSSESTGARLDSFVVLANMVLAVDSAGLFGGFAHGREVDPDILLFPNPTSSSLWLSGQDRDAFQRADLYDAFGAFISSLPIEQQHISLPLLPEGHYYLRLLGPVHSSSHHIILQR